MGNGWRAAWAGVLVLGALGVAACGDDSDDQATEEDVVTEEEYAAEAERLCAQHATELADEEVDMVADGQSDADVVSYIEVEVIPRTRAIMQGLVDFGLPPARAAEILQAFNEIDAQLSSVDSDPYGYIDRSRRGDPSDEGTLETSNAYIDERLALAEVPCLQDASP
jgi:hypothetical protein